MDDKYVVFKKHEFYGELNKWLGTWVKDVPVNHLMDRLEQIRLDDGVVIRRQDKFASPCLLTYATMIAMVADIHPDQITQLELQKIADYFHEQGVLAGEEGWKLPTL